MLQNSLLSLAIFAGSVVAVLLLLRSPARLRLPVLALVAVFDIAVGPSGLGWLRTDLPLMALAVAMIVVVLVLAGLQTGSDTSVVGRGR
jgi:hypothetical protein